MAQKKSSLKKSSTKHKHISTNTTHIMLKKGVVIYAALVFIMFVLVSVSWFTVHQFITYKTNSDRESKIYAIYDSLNLGDTYRTVKQDVFGDKRVYSWDKNRTYASSIEYGHNDTPQNTAADLKSKIEAAGFVPAGSAYEGSVDPQYYYKNSKGNYVRVTVTSKYAQDAVIYGTLNNNDPLANHKNEAPSYVTIKVNLDDNNE